MSQTRLPCNITSVLTADAQIATFTKVSDGSPDLALLLIKEFYRYMIDDFECFVHQISSKSGLLINKLAPITPQTVRKIIEDLILLRQKRSELLSEYRALNEKVSSNPEVSNIDEKQLAILISKVRKIIDITKQKESDPDYVKIQELMESNSNLGCKA